MPPQNQPSGQSGDPYAFFMESKPKPKRSRIPGGGSSFAKIIIAAIIVLVALGILAVVIGSLRANKQDSSPGLLGVIKAQQEITRVNDLGTSHIQAASLLNFNASTKVAIPSAQAEAIAYYKQHGGKIDLKALKILKQDPRIDQSLDAALAASVYDSAYRSAMKQLFVDYADKLQKLSANPVTLQSEQDLADKDLASANLLLTMLIQE